MAQLKWADSLHGMLDLGHRLHSMPAVVDMSHMIRCSDTSTPQANVLVLSGPMPHRAASDLLCLLRTALYGKPQAAAGRAYKGFKQGSLRTVVCMQATPRPSRGTEDARAAADAQECGLGPPQPPLCFAQGTSEFQNALIFQPLGTRIPCIWLLTAHALVDMRICTVSSSRSQSAACSATVARFTTWG